LFNKSQTTLIQYPAAKTGSYYAITNPVTNIGYSAFNGCTNLTSISVGNSVASIGDRAFQSCSGLTSMTVPSSVTNIGLWAFFTGRNLTTITVDALNANYTGVDGVLFDKNQTMLIQYPSGKAGSYYPIPNSVTSIGTGAFEESSLASVTIPNGVTNFGAGSTFAYCTNLTSITIPNSVTNIGLYAFFDCLNLTSITIGNGAINIGDWAFAYCSNLTGVYFQGNAPSIGSSAFYNANNVTVFYLPGTKGWSYTFDGRPTKLWNPIIQIQTRSGNFGVRTNRFGFTVTANVGLSIVVEACTNLANPTWSPVGTNTLTNTLFGGSSYFSDPHWTNYQSRFYRLRSP